jgi:hypothetical protein
VKGPITVLKAEWIVTPGIGDLPDRWCLMVTYLEPPVKRVTVLLCSDSVGLS